MTDLNDEDRSNLAENVPQGFDPMMLIAEWNEQREAVQNELTREIEPKGLIEQMYVEDLAYIICDIRQLRRYKIAIQRGAMLPALRTVLEQILKAKDFFVDQRERLTAKRLAIGTLFNKKDQIKVENLLATSSLTDTSVEAEAWRSVSGDLALIERMLTSFELRRDRCLANIARYRTSLAQAFKRAGERIIEAEEISIGAEKPSLEAEETSLIPRLAI